jgi:predicted PurR-regulated permease PerM
MNLLHRRWRLPEPAAVLLIYLGILAILAFLCWLLVQPVIHQFSAFLNDLPQFTSQLSTLFGHIQHWLGNNPQISSTPNGLQSQAISLIQGILPLLLSLPLLLGRLLLSAVVVAVMTFFWLTGVEQLRPFFVGLFPDGKQPLVDDMLSDISHRIGGYLRGVVFNMFVIGILTGVGDWLLGVPYAALLGILAGLTELLPLIGPWISGGVAVVVCLALATPLKAVEVIAFYIFIQQLEGNTLVPLVMMGPVDLNPLTVLVAVLLGVEVLGLVGGVLAVPIAAIVKVLIVRVVAPIVRQAGTASRPAVPDGPSRGPP